MSEVSYGYLKEAEDRIADLEQQLSEMREERDSALSAESVLVEEREQAEQETARLRDMMGRVQSLEQQLSTLEPIVKAVAHIGIDFGYGRYELEDCFIEQAREAQTEATRRVSEYNGRLEQQLAERQWVSVEDRLPEEGTIVLVHWVDGFIDTARYRPYWVSNFTHWMKLPEPPQEQDK